MDQVSVRNWGFQFYASSSNCFADQKPFRFYSHQRTLISMKLKFQGVWKKTVVKDINIGQKLNFVFFVSSDATLSGLTSNVIYFVVVNIRP